MLEVGFTGDAAALGIDERCSDALRSEHMGMLSMLAGVSRVSAPAPRPKRATGDTHASTPRTGPEQAAQRFKLALQAVRISPDLNGWFGKMLAQPAFAAKMMAAGWSCNCSPKTDAEFSATLGRTRTPHAQARAGRTAEASAEADDQVAAARAEAGRAAASSADQPHKPPNDSSIAGAESIDRARKNKNKRSLLTPGGPANDSKQARVGSPVFAGGFFAQK